MAPAELVRTQYRFLRSRAREMLGILPRLAPVRHSYPLARLGSEYGGWTYFESDLLMHSTIVSCGLGQDASFDVEFATRYQAKVVLVDPTPKAIEHFFEISHGLGSKRSLPYSMTGSQSIGAYDLSSLRADRLVLCDKALWVENTSLKFYCPRNPNHVSHSIVNFQNHYSEDTDHIEVDAITIETLLDLHGCPTPPLMKLDIEGAEIEVIVDMMTKGILPIQILLEYDELSAPSKKSRNRIECAHHALLTKGYELIHRDYPSNFLYVRRN